MSRPLTYRCFKGITGKFGALNLSLKLPDLESKEPGVLFLEMTSPKGKNDYDWDKKISFKLTLTDCGKLLHFLETGVGNTQEGKNLSLVHDPKAGSKEMGQIVKTLNISSPGGLKEKGAFFDLSLTEKKEKKLQHKVPLSADEIKVLSVLLRAAVPVFLGWVA